MKKKRFTEEQVMGILQQADRGEQTIGEICRAPGVSEQSFYRWRQKFGGRRMGQAKLDHCPLSATLGPAKIL
jgi:putative transposase